MSLFGKLVKTAVNVVALPAEIVRDVYSLGGVATGQEKPYTLQRIDKLVEDADED